MMLSFFEGDVMAEKVLRFCSYPRCNKLVKSGYCEEHQKRMYEQSYEARRKSAHERGYTSKWYRYTKLFLKQPENQLCKLQLDNKCNIIAECVDHIIPPKDPQDSLFWDESNHQAACIHCNSVKGHRAMKGKHGKINLDGCMNDSDEDCNEDCEYVEVENDL